MQFILSIDQGTTSSRAIIFDHDGNIVAVSQREFEQIFPKPGWVEHDANEIWESQYAVMKDVMLKAGSDASDIAAIGITNQRETTVVWHRDTGEPIANAIVWQDRRTSGKCDDLRVAGHAETFQDKTGLVLDAYFSGTKVQWLLDNVPGAREKAENGELAFGTIDSWLIWKLTNGQKHVTDVTNASRTLLLDIHTAEWSDELMGILHVPSSVLPEVRSSSEIYAHTADGLFDANIPIAGIAGDQQAALFGQMCIKKGSAKNTYGTGCFMLMNIGNQPVRSKNNLLTTIAWKIGDEITYALEGSIFIAGAVVQWLRDGLGLIETSGEVEALALSVEDNGGVYLVPAFAGLGAPHWDQYARGTIVGLTRGSSKAHIARAALESIAYQTNDVLDSMNADAGVPLAELRVDGGASANNLLMQFQSDVLGVPVNRPRILETTALGAAYLAGLAVGYWNSLDEVSQQWQIDNKFQPSMERDHIDGQISQWKKAVERAKSWSI